MSKTTMLGLDLGTDSMKWARMERGKVVQSDAVQLPENLVQDGRITSLDLMADQLKAAIGKTTRLRKPTGSPISASLMKMNSPAHLISALERTRRTSRSSSYSGSRKRPL